MEGTDGRVDDHVYEPHSREGGRGTPTGRFAPLPFGSLVFEFAGETTMIWTRQRPYGIYGIPTNLDRDARLTDGPLRRGHVFSTRPLKGPLPLIYWRPDRNAQVSWGRGQNGVIQPHSEHEILGELRGREGGRDNV